MPAFGLAHKPSRTKMRSVSADAITTTPTSQSQRVAMQHHQQQPPISPAPLPIESSSNSGFKMFNWKRKGSGSSTGHGVSDGTSTGSRPYYPAEPPRPILKTAVSDQGSSNRGIRFAASAGGVWDTPSTSTGPLASAPNIAVRGDANGQGGGGQPLFQRSPRSPAQGQSPQLQIQIHHANLERQSQALESMGMTSPTRSVSRTKSTSPRRSSRPASPSATSFGHRIRTESAPTTMTSCSPTSRQVSTHYTPQAGRESGSSPSVMCTPPAFCPSHVTTPPVAYCSSMQSRAPPPPSPYRPTTTQDRSWSSTTRALPEHLPLTREMAPRPPRHSSLFTNITTPRSSRPGSRPTSGASISGLAGVDVPMLNIIPATPQEMSDEFSAGASAGPSRRRVPEELGEAVQLHRMTEISLEDTDNETEEEISTEVLPKSESTPAIQVELDFSPFSPTIDLALDDYISNSNNNNIPTRHVEPEYVHASVAEEPTTQEPVQPSPPLEMESYPSLPSLSSQTSITSGMSLRSSSSMSSVMTFPDVEEALGSMLASLSDVQISFPYDTDMMTESVKSQQDQHDEQEREQQAQHETPSNPGLGLGLDFPQPSFITAPLSPRKSKPKAKPTRINTALAQSVDLKSFDPTPGSAPPVINHRVAFYGTARAHPRSPSSGVFTRSLTDISTHCDQPQPQPQPDAIGVAVGSSTSGLEVEVDPETEGEATTPTLRSRSKGLPESQPSSSALSTASRDSVVSIISTATMSSQGTTIGCRDSVSISGHSESSDEDLHTASIINLTPVGTSRSPFGEMGFGLGLGMGMEMGMEMEARDEEIMVDDVGLAL